MIKHNLAACIRNLIPSTLHSNPSFSSKKARACFLFVCFFLFLTEPQEHRESTVWSSDKSNYAVFQFRVCGFKSFTLKVGVRHQFINTIVYRWASPALYKCWSGSCWTSSPVKLPTRVSLIDGLEYGMDSEHTQLLVYITGTAQSRLNYLEYL